MLAQWGCGRRPSVVQAQRQIHRALRAAVPIAETVVDDTTDHCSNVGKVGFVVSPSAGLSAICTSCCCISRNDARTSDPHYEDWLTQHPERLLPAVFCISRVIYE